MDNKKFTNRDIAVILDNEGIGYAIMNYCSPEDLADKYMAKLWRKARVLLCEIDSIAYTAREEDEPSDEDNF